MAIHESKGERLVYAWRFGLTPAWLDRCDGRFASAANRLATKLGLKRNYYLPKIED